MGARDMDGIFWYLVRSGTCFRLGGRITRVMLHSSTATRPHALLLMVVWLYALLKLLSFG